MAARKRSPQSRSKKTSTPLSRSSLPLALAEPSPGQKRLAFLTLLLMIVLLGVAAALIEVFIKPLFAMPMIPPQRIAMTVYPDRYVPDTFSVIVNRPVSWSINASGASECTKTLVVPQLDRRVFFTADAAEINFTPHETGTIYFSCLNASVHGAITVVS